MKDIVHMLSVVCGVIAALSFVHANFAARSGVSPTLSQRSRVRMWLFPEFPVASDYTDAGWRIKKRQQVAFACMVVLIFIFVLSS